jgi:hypothetical protein
MMLLQHRLHEHRQRDCRWIQPLAMLGQIHFRDLRQLRPHYHVEEIHSIDLQFDQLYEEALTRRRMMVVSLHDRLSGHASRVKSLERFLVYAMGHPGVWFARMDEIAAHAPATPGITRKLKRELAENGGLAANTREREGA